MTCQEVLSRGKAKLDDCLHHAAIHDASALSAAMGDLCEFVEQSTAVECLGGAEGAARCGERCALREEYKSKLLDFQAEVPSIRALLGSERARLAQEKRFLEVARSWAEYSQDFSSQPPSIHTNDIRARLSEQSDRRR